MGAWENLVDFNSYISELRHKLWKEDRIRISGYTYSEWKREQESRVKK